MNKNILIAISLLFSASVAQAQFSFHWAFPYYAFQNMEVNNGNRNILVFTQDKDYNNFKKVDKRLWSKTNDFYYVRTLEETTYKAFLYICTDGSTTVADLEKLHNDFPKNVIFFVHRTKIQWPQDTAFLEKMLTERPGWAYGGDPYNPHTPILRSDKSLFTHNDIILGNSAPGEGL